MSESKSMSLSVRIFIGMAAGALIGLMINQFGAEVKWIEPGVHGL